MRLRIASWNVNSIRQRLGHLAQLVESHRPDVVCLQETKVDDPLFPADQLRALGFAHQVFRGQKGYNGVAILSRRPFLDHGHRIWCRRDDKRHVNVTLDGGIELHNFYVPSGGPVPDPEQNDKFAHKLAFLRAMARWARTEARGKHLLLVGDLNVAPLANDVWNHKRLVRSVGHTPEESARIAEVLKAGGFVDVGRHFVPETEFLFTWWGYRFPQSLERNYGWRLDHVWAAGALIERIDRFEVVKETRAWERPSDHVPVIVDVT